MIGGNEMLDISFIRQNPDIVKKAARDKLMAVDIDRLLGLDQSIRGDMAFSESLRAERNKLSKQTEKSGVATVRVRAIKQELSEIEDKLRTARAEFDAIMLTVPSIPAPEVPVGAGEQDNVELRRVGDVRVFDFEPLDHVELCRRLDLLDIPRAVKFAGSRSYFLKNEAALLEMALCRFTLDFLCQRDFTPMIVPQMVKESAMRGTGYFPTGYDQAYKLTEDDLYLVGTSEVSLVSYHQDEVLDLSSLPVRLAGYSSCFRREAGTYGKDTRGLYRVHQFQKVEQVVLCDNDPLKAEALHHELLYNSEKLLQALGLPYRVGLACTGELGIGQIKKHEIETWMPSRGAYCETHSCSSFGEFQARRSNIRFRDLNGALRYCHTLNNTGIASPRILIPLLENNQNVDGSVNIPEALQPYMGGRTIIECKEALS
jgi:seryl-tRNA synthetase